VWVGSGAWVRRRPSLCLNQGAGWEIDMSYTNDFFTVLELLLRLYIVSPLLGADTLLYGNIVIHNTQYGGKLRPPANCRVGGWRENAMP
jgi:hypothetical protein